MERTVAEAMNLSDVAPFPNIVSIGKPPWSSEPHRGRLERLILQLGAGRGKFSEVTGIPRSIGCIGNNSFILRREPLSPERVRELIREFQTAGGRELWLTNYDSLEYLLSVASYASEIGIEEVYAVVRIEDVDSVRPVDGVRFIVEFEYSPENFRRIEPYGWLHGALVMVRGHEVEELKRLATTFAGEVYIDVLFPGSARKLDFNVIELKRVFTPTSEKYHDCLAGTLSITADGYILPCPLLRNYVIADARETGIKAARRKKRLRDFWTMTKDRIEGCSKCPFKYLCHDCRALEYQATGQIDGLEYCFIMPLELKN
ncbi:SPASM domain-containing protein [Thermococcus sp. M36]|uniref:SPASM domain-containing protein n=1 Tax=Thermococcus sp. M36 TaxID=1638261 RepID=UPI00143A6A01|nr:SPASM domain-containing protein [Thermococcus sp. M36]NJE05470.1 SPASM domain-containing protein [Thermococcus sp. M36]